jgi:lysophospholipase L1-like esterase
MTGLSADHRLSRARVLALVAVALALAACAPSTPRLPKLAPDAVVLAFGDSLTAGTGADDAAAYPAVLAQLIGRRVVNAGVPGEVSAEGRERLPALLAELRPQLLILCHGGNDLLRGREPGSIDANLRGMIRAAQAQGVSVVLVGVPAPNLARAVPDFYRTLARELKLPYEGEILGEILGDRSLKSDPIHPNAAGYRLFAQRMAAVLKAAGAL